MARPIKEGVSYFPLDVDFFEDEKVQFISARFGTKGEAVLVRLLCRIYRNGYYLKFDDDAALLFARSAGDNTLSGLVKEVVKESVKRGLFNQAVFNELAILTSRGIQERYYKICTDSKRKGWEISPELDLLQRKLAFHPEETAINSGESTQRREKKSKEEKNKLKGAEFFFPEETLLKNQERQPEIPKPAAAENTFANPPPETEKTVNPDLVLQKKLVQMPWTSEVFADAWTQWKEYKLLEFKGFCYRSPQSEQAALMQLSSMAEGQENQALLILQHTMGNRWQGFVKPKTSSENESRDSKKTGNRNGSGASVDTGSAFAKIDAMHRKS